MNKILKQDLESFALPADLSARLVNKTIIVTGATGLIGSTIVRCVDALKIGARFILPVRSREKATTLFGKDSDNIRIIETDLEKFFDTLDSECDFIIHCASPTNGEYMSAHPAETFLLAVDSTRSIMEYCCRHKVESVVYVSSIEYYGQIFDDEPVTEEMMGFVDRQSPRNSYSLGKQAAEFLAFCYSREYGVPVRTARLTQTFGAGISSDDKRVFAQFARSVIRHHDITLHTRGASAKPYCYTTDCVSAIIHIMLKGTAGEAYNVATPGTYVTIKELAELFRSMFAPETTLTVDTSVDRGYAPETRVNLIPDKLLRLGWRPKHTLPEMLRRLVESLRN